MLTSKTMTNSLDLKIGIPSSPKKQKDFKKKLAIGLFLLGVIAVFYFFARWLMKDPELAAQKEAQTLAEKVGELMILPTDEVPTIATVSNLELLKGQTFFENASKGDKVLIFSNAKIAVLYNPILDKIVTIAPVNFGPSANKIISKPIIQDRLNVEKGENSF